MSQLAETIFLDFMAKYDLIWKWAWPIWAKMRWSNVVWHFFPFYRPKMTTYNRFQGCTHFCRSLSNFDRYRLYYNYLLRFSKLMLPRSNSISVPSRYVKTVIFLSWPQFKSSWPENLVTDVVFNEEHDGEFRKVISDRKVAVFCG